MKKNTVHLLAIVLVFLGCNRNSDKKSKDKNPDSVNINHNDKPSELPLDPSKIECVPEQYYFYRETASGYNMYLTPGAFKEKTYLYSSLNSNKKIIDTLRIGTEVNILKDYEDYFLICSSTGKTGYVKKEDLYMYSSLLDLGYDNDKTNFGRYLIGIQKYKKIENKEYNENLLKIIKLNSEKQITETFIDSIPVSYSPVRELHYCALKNAKSIFYLKYSYYDEIGVVFDHFIVDNGKKLSRLIVTSGSGDGGYGDESTVYLPVRLTNGKKIVLAKNGILSVNEINGKPETFPYPTDSGIPIDELVIVENSSYGLVEDDKGNEIEYNEDGTMALQIDIVETIYYRWNGTSLQKVKTIKGK